MRTNIVFKLVCSVCGSDLEENGDSKIEYHSSLNSTVNMRIKPCSNCYRKNMEPLQMIKKALNMINEKHDKQLPIKSQHEAMNVMTLKEMIEKQQQMKTIDCSSWGENEKTS